jgi:hypothetical protein
LTDGNGYLYFKVPEGAQRVTPDNVQAILSLRPDKVTINLKQNGRNKLSAATISDYIKNYQYAVTGDKILPEFILHSKSYMNDRSESDYRSMSPLWAGKRNVDNLTAVYSARYNVYVNNGAAGYLSKKTATQGMDSAFGDRDKIVEEINATTGLTGHRNLYGISSVPIEFTNTLISIKDLMPIEEWTANFLVLAGLYGVDKDLLPLVNGTTFTNKEIAEAKIWADIATTYADDVCSDLTAMFGLKGSKLSYRKNRIPFLQSQRKTQLEGDKLLIENLNAMKAAGYNVDKQIAKIIESYE